MKRIALFGANGQLGRRLHEHFGSDILPLTRARVDLEQPAHITDMLAQLAPDAIINAAAYTDVEAAEDNEALARRINAEAPRIMAGYAAKQRIPFLHISTDYVFDGSKPAPYSEGDATHPLNAYGRSKREGEQAVLAAYPQALVLRTAWLYDTRGRNFLNSIATRARESDRLRVVADQFGTPSFARDVARAIALLLGSLDTVPYRGLLHMTNSGDTSWHGFATAIIDEMRKREHLPVQQVEAITSELYPTRAQRPKNSRLSNRVLAERFHILLPPWEDALSRCIKEWYAQH